MGGRAWAAARTATMVGLLSACSGSTDDAESLREGLAGLPRDTTSAETAPEPLPVALPEGLPDTVGFSVPPSETADTLPSPPLRPDAPRDTRPWSPGEAPRIPAAGEWTLGVVERRGGSGVMATLRDVRTARNEAFDRLVLEFEGDELPRYHVEYVDRPARQCGSGNEVRVAGDGWLRVRMEPARAHDDRGRATVSVRASRPQLPVVRELRLTCDFEGQVEWVVGVSSPNRYRVLELHAPARLVVDVGHGR